ncbi:MAG: MerR family transcriptional regulator [Elusimicrobiaceae bacterium]|nr:MerR family transcriptional regulator [Elusimicrobiaceae bacterium]
MTISQVSQKYGLPADTLRYYEKAGLIPPVHRTESGIRDYQPEDCNWVEFIKCMRSAGLSIETLQKYVTLFRKGNKTLQARKALLLAERDRLQAQIKAMQTTLKRLNYKIDIYDDKIVHCEKNLH